MPGPVSLTIGSALSQYLLVNIRVQALKKERMENRFSLEGIQFQSAPRLNVDVYDLSIFR